MTRSQVAIITRTKDRPVFLQRAMQSVLKQDFTDWVHVIVNDGGDPKLVDLLVEVHKEAYAGRVKVVHHAESKGMQNASNAGLAAVESTYAVIHDDDDSWYTDFLSKSVSFLEAKGPESPVQGVVTQTTQIMEEITLSGQIEELKRRPYYPFAFVNLGELRKRNIFAPIAFLYRKKAHEKIGLFRQEFDVLGDHDFNLRFLRHFEIGVIPTFHAYYHWRHGSHGNTVTRGREGHRQMLNRMKNTYYREALENPDVAVGDLEGVDFPEPDGTDPIPFKLRTEESKPPRPIPDFSKDFKFEILSLDVFDTVLKRRCHHPKDVFKFLEARAVSELGLPEKPYALAREQAEALARKEVRPEISTEVTLDEIYPFVAKLCGLKKKQTKDLMALELALEAEYLYGDPRWIEYYRKLKESGQRVIFVSDMYLKTDTMRKILEGCGFPDPEVYVSCDLQASKHEGALQEKVVEKLGVKPASILHVGDNFHSDYLKTVHAGWQAFHWSREFGYIPWYAEVDPYIHNSHDLLSPRIMGELARLGMLDETTGEDLITKLGREVAGPFYLAYLLWVIQEARKDGVRKLLLIGRDGYYWEKTLQILAKKENLEIEFTYLHASRKVFNFASFFTLDDTAIEFLSTPNPALRVKDFIDRTGLDSSAFTEFIKMAGFDDPEEVLTNEMGGRFLEDNYQAQLEKLFRLLRPELELMFAEDRAGTLNVLKEAGYNHEDCAFVDIGWNGSCIRPIGRLLGLDKPEQVKAYFFGTWREVLKGSDHLKIKSFFMHLSEPLDHFRLIRESVNLLESLNAAPFPTLMAFHTEGDEVVPHFSKYLKSGFSIDQQERLWKGAKVFLDTVLENGLPETGESGGHCYLFLVLNRLLREPSQQEVKTWGAILHSDGFGIEIYKPLVEAVTPDLTGDALMAAYRGSNWKRGFLSSLSDTQRQFVIERIEDDSPKSFEKLRADLEYKIRQADELWGEKERYKWQVDNLTQTLSKLEKTSNKLQSDLDYKTQQADKFWKEKEEYKWRAEHSGEIISRLEKTAEKLQGDLDWKTKQSDEFWAENERHKIEAQSLKEQLQMIAQDQEVRLSYIATLESQITELKEQIISAGTREKEFYTALSETRARLSDVETEHGRQSSYISTLEKSVESFERQVAELNEQIASAGIREDELNAVLSETQTHLSELESAHADLVAERDRLKALLLNRGKLLKVFFSGKIPEKD
ncbi:glycosyltransferase [Puniceicoccales bacterium CK1056]|uniref:Glycosyltransferase n=1 Tax=Oceanipulchritudo coccoides TaxID=2706888 RepID=A0A6B2M1K8_9BACT|nr:glycosyltransferase [Oceanipulchritudo coccoides]NDV62232.1 glycosyltransferase [Oceanipulchritudo coccoides]